MASLFGSEMDDPDDARPPPKPLLHAQSGVQLRAYGMEMGHATTGCDPKPSRNSYGHRQPQC